MSKDIDELAEILLNEGLEGDERKEKLSNNEEDKLVSIYSTHPRVVSAYREFLPVVSINSFVGGAVNFSSPVDDPDGPSEINEVIAIQGNQKADIVVERETVDGFETVEATLSTTQHGEKVFVDVPRQRQGAFKKSYALEYKRRFESLYVDNIWEIAKENGYFLSEKFRDDLEEFEKTGEMTEALERNAEEIASELNEEAVSIAEGWTERYLRDVNDHHEFHVVSSELNV